MILSELEMQDSQIVKVELRMHLFALLIHGVLLGQVVKFALRVARPMMEGLGWHVRVLLCRRGGLLRRVLVMIEEQLHGLVIFAAV